MVPPWVAQRALLVTLLGWILVATACGGGTKLGIQDVDPEFVVNEYQAGDQLGPALAATPDGHFVLVWESGCLQQCEGQDGSEFGVYGRRFDPGGVPLSGEFRVNETIDFDQADPAVAMLPDGRFAVAWANESGVTGQSWDVRLRLYDAEGVPLTGELAVNEELTDTQWRPKVALLEDGDALVVWEHHGEWDESIRGRRFADTGAPAGPPVELVAGADEPDLAVRPDGRGVLVFSALGIEAQRLDGLAPVGPRIGVNVEYASTYPFPRVALGPDAEFVVGWAGFWGEGQDYDIRVRAFDPEGDPTSPEIGVNDQTVGFQQYPVVAISPSGHRFVVAWESDRGDGSDIEVIAEVFTLDGRSQEADFVVNSYTADFQEEPSLAATRDGFLVAWQSSPESGVGYEVWLRRYPLWP